MMKVQAPWSSEVVDALNEWQCDQRVHPYTCAHRGDGRHRDEGKLIATPDGWVCPSCTYTQGWAHAPAEGRA